MTVNDFKEGDEVWCYLADEYLVLRKVKTFMGEYLVVLDSEGQYQFSHISNTFKTEDDAILTIFPREFKNGRLEYFIERFDVLDYETIIEESKEKFPELWI